MGTEAPPDSAEGGGHAEAKTRGAARPQREIRAGNQEVTPQSGPLPFAFAPKPSPHLGGFPQLVT